MKNPKKIIAGTAFAFVFISASLAAGRYSQADHKQKYLDSVQANPLLAYEDVSFSQEPAVEYEIPQTYQFDTVNKPEIITNSTDNILLSNQKVADPSQRYRSTDEYMFVSKDTKLFKEDDLNSEALKDVEYADYVHLVGKDPYNNDGFSKIEFDGKTGFIETQSLTKDILFKKTNCFVYAYDQSKIYSDVELTKEVGSLEKIHGIKAVGDSHDIVKVLFGDKECFMNKSDVSFSMLFNDTNESVWTLAEEKVYTSPVVNPEESQTVSKYAELKRIGISEEWSKIELSDGTFGYIPSDKVTTERPISKGEEIANFALQFVGNPYVWGGTSLTNGADCSGFTQAVYAHFGYHINRTSTTQRENGRPVAYEDLQPGDLVFYSGHVTIYIGNGQIVHASNSAPYPQGGIKVSNVNYAPIEAIRRIVD